MQSHLLLSCLLLSMTLSWSYATPLPSEAADGPHDVRWRLMSGMETAYRYAIKLLQQQELCDSEPLLNVSYDLERVLSGVCELLEWYEFIAQEINGSDYHAVLGQTVLDSCNWFNCLVTGGEVSASPWFLNLSDSCELGNMSRLTHYCLEASLRNSFRLHNIVNDRIYTPLSNYYSGIVVNVNISQWIVASSIPPHQEDSIVSTLTQTYSCINEFI